MADRENDQNRFFCGFLFGGILGALAGLLFAPKPGRELRSELREKGSEAFEDAKRFYAESQEKAKAIVEDARRRAEDLTREAERCLAEARGTAKRILAGSEEKE
jgi:gas vesicle protein